GDGRPVREILDALADIRIGQHVHALELHAQGGEDLHHARGEAALREDRRALHVEQHGIVGNLLLDAVGGGGGRGHGGTSFLVLLYSSGTPVCKARAWSSLPMRVPSAR